MDFNVSNSRQCVKLPRVTENEVNSNIYSPDSSFSLRKSTRMISSPIWRMQSHGMEYSFSLEKHQQNFPGSGMIRAFRRAVSQQNSTSRGQPRLRQVWILITSFCFSSQMRINSSPGMILWKICKIYASPIIDTLCAFIL